MFSSLLRRSPRAFPLRASCRSYATAVPKGRPNVPKPKPTQRIISQSIPQVKQPLPAEIQQARSKAGIAEQILNAGRDVIYKAPSQTGMLFTAWTVFASGCMCCLYFVSNGFHDGDAMRKRGLPWWVPPVYKAVMAFMGLCSGAFLAQSFSFITAIKLVKDGGAVKLLVSQRPWFPIWRHHKFVIEPAQLQIDRKMAYFAQSPAARRTPVALQAVAAQKEGGVLQRMAVTPFLIMRKLFFHEGVIRALIPTGKNGSKERWVRIDLDGKVADDIKDLLAVATIRA